MQPTASSHPRDILSHWLTHRKLNSDGVLISLEELREQTMEDGWFTNVPTIAGPSWRAKVRKLPTQEEFNKTFYESYPLTKDFLEGKGNCAAGGSVSRICSGFKTGDVDLYLTQGTLAERQKAVESFVEGLEPSHDDKKKWFSMKGLCHVWKGGNAPMDIILRKYNNMAEIPYGFDIPSGVFDGETTWFTPAAALMVVYGVIIVDPRLSSTTYATRLIKYHSRGFALTFPSADPTLFENLDDTHIFGNLHVHVRRRKKGSIVQAHLELGFTESYSDYKVDFTNDITPERQFGRLIKDKSLIFREMPPGVDQLEEDTVFVNLEESRNAWSDALRSDQIREIVDQKNFTFQARHFEENIWRIHRTMHSFGEPEYSIRVKIDRFKQKIDNANPKDLCNIQKYLDERAEKLVEMMKAGAMEYQENGLWIVQDPQTQFTSSLYPKPEKTIDWFGLCVEFEQLKTGRATWKEGPRYNNNNCIVSQEPTKNKPCLKYPCGHMVLLKHAKMGAALNGEGQCERCGQKIVPRKAVEPGIVSL